MSTSHSRLEPFFQQMVRNSYAGKLGIHDTAITQYVARLLCEFSEADKLYKVRDDEGRPSLARRDGAAADPVHGTATSFDAERAVRKHIGDYALFVSGMYPESMDPYRRRHGQQSFEELVKVGKESYYIVSQFDLEEYADEAPMFRRLAGWFDRCIYGLRLVREELTHNKPGFLARPRELARLCEGAAERMGNRKSPRSDTPTRRQHIPRAVAEVKSPPARKLEDRAR
jgi:hypothetical protein